MKKRSIFVVSVLSLVVLASCNNASVPSTSDSIFNSISNTELPSISDSTGSDVSTSPSDPSVPSISVPPVVDPNVLLNEALNKDYSNALFAYAINMGGETVEVQIEINYDGYTIIDKNNPDDDYLYYHDYESVSHLYFGNNYGNGEAWLKEGYHNAPLSLEYTYLNLTQSIDLLSDMKEDIFYDGDSGLYIVTGEDNVETLNQEMYGFAYTSDVSAVGFLIDHEAKAISRIFGLENPNSPGVRDGDGVIIQIEQVGSTSFNGHLPPKPTAENVKTYAEWSGTEPWNPIFPTSIEVSLEEGEDTTLEIEDKVQLEVAYTPSNTNQTDVKWFSSDNDIAEMGIAGEVTAIKEGSVKVWAETNALEQDKVIKSNEIILTVNPVKESTLTGKTHDLTFVGELDGDKIVTTNSLNSELNVDLVAEGCYLQEAHNKENKWDEGENVLVFNIGSGSGSASQIYDLREATATGLSFHYGLFWEADIANLNDLDEFKVYTSEDKETWTEVKDLLPQVQQEVSKVSYKLVEVTFEHTSYIKLEAKNSFIGHPFRLAFSSISFYKDGEPEPDPIDVERIELSLEKDVLEISETTKVSANITPSNADDKTVTYISSDESVATVSNTGEVRALKEGITNISARSVNNHGENVTSNAVTLTVNPAKPLATPTAMLGTWTASNDDYGSYSDLVLVLTEKEAQFTYDDTTNVFTIVELTQYGAKYQGADENDILEVNLDGSVIILSYSYADIYIGALVDGNGMNKLIEVSSVNISSPEKTLVEGETLQLSATINPTNASNKTLTWNVSDKTVASISSKGELTALKPGTVVVSAEAANGVKSNDITFTVEAKPAGEDVLGDDIVGTWTGTDIYNVDYGTNNISVTINKDGTALLDVDGTTFSLVFKEFGTTNQAGDGVTEYYLFTTTKNSQDMFGINADGDIVSFLNGLDSDFDTLNTGMGDILSR